MRATYCKRERRKILINILQWYVNIALNILLNWQSNNACLHINDTISSLLAVKHFNLHFQTLSTSLIQALKASKVTVDVTDTFKFERVLEDRIKVINKPSIKQ